MTDFTIREIRDLREPIAQDKKAEREAALEDALALIAKFDREH
jgi:hypothetical protein